MEGGTAAAPAREPFSPERLKHLEMIQAAITRMAANSFAVKNWAVAVSSTALALATREGRIGGLLAISVIVVFWGLDAYYLSQERAYRTLFNIVRVSSEVPPFQMSTKAYSSLRDSWGKAFRSQTLLAFYGILLTAMLAISMFYYLR